MVDRTVDGLYLGGPHLSQKTACVVALYCEVITKREQHGVRKENKVQPGPFNPGSTVHCSL